MSIEVELKFAVAALEPLRQQVEALGGHPGQPMTQRDLYFNHPGRDFAQTDEAFRLRSVDDENCLTYKGPHLDEAVKARREIEVPFASGADTAEAMTHLLQSLGFRPVREVVKRRVSYSLEWHGRAFSIELDTIDGLGDYLEIETIAPQDDWNAAREAVLSLASELGLSGVERRSYLELLLDRDRHA